MTSTPSASDVFVDGLRNAHAMERQALSMEPQAKRFEHHPKVSALRDRRICETKGEIARPDEILATVAESASTLKDLPLSFAGTMPDFAVLIAAEGAGAASAIPPLAQSLQEKRRMAAQIGDGLPGAVCRDIELSGTEQRA